MRKVSIIGAGNVGATAAMNIARMNTFYAARHTWASLARKEGVDKSTIDDCLGHKGQFQAADIYAERAWDLIQEANQIVLELFTW